MPTATRLIFQTSRANKVGLSRDLDSTLRRVHDMKVFGAGILSEFSSRKTYEHFVLQRYHIYSAMESSFDAAERGAIVKVWNKFSLSLRQKPSLIHDLKVLGVKNPERTEPSPATKAYIKRIQSACGDRLIGHFYCRYFADLFGGSMLGKPTSLALNIPLPSFYRFPSHVERERGAFIESIYEEINAAGEESTVLAEEEGSVYMEDSGGKVDARTARMMERRKELRRALIEETEIAFQHNVDMITELGYANLFRNALTGAINLSSNYLWSSFRRGRQRSVV